MQSTYRAREPSSDSPSRIHISSIEITVNDSTPDVGEVARGRTPRSECALEVAIDEEVEREWAVIDNVKVSVRENR